MEWDPYGESDNLAYLNTVSVSDNENLEYNLMSFNISSVLQERVRKISVDGSMSKRIPDLTKERLSSLWKI